MVTRPSEHRLSAKLVSTFADRGCHVVRVTDPHGRILGFLHGSCYVFSQSSSSIVLTRLQWTLFQTHYFSENLVAQGIEPGPLEL
jgi:hypothetical protein